jgi:hypothetical protein
MKCEKYNDLEVIIDRMLDEGWSELSYTHFEGEYSVKLQKGNKQINLTYKE